MWTLAHTTTMCFCSQAVYACIMCVRECAVLGRAHVCVCWRAYDDCANAYSEAVRRLGVCSCISNNFSFIN